jgi:hypothetical protein
MKQKAFVMDKANLEWATERAKMWVNDLSSLANDVAKDVRKASRTSAQECKSCFYGSRGGGSAITERDCASCGETQVYGSTNTDCLCKQCAVKLKLCKHCAGDIYMKVRRKACME